MQRRCLRWIRNVLVLSLAGCAPLGPHCAPDAALQQLVFWASLGICIENFTDADRPAQAV